MNKKCVRIDNINYDFKSLKDALAFLYIIPYEWRVQLVGSNVWLYRPNEEVVRYDIAMGKLGSLSFEYSTVLYKGYE